MAEARDCLDEAVAGTIARRESIPPADAPKRGERMVPLDASLAFKALLYMVMEDSGMTKVDLAARLGIDEKEVRRMLDPAHRGTRIVRYETALAACGFAAEVSVRPMPGTEAA
jgi:antitoxin HicB